MNNKGVHWDRRETKVAEAALTGARFVKLGTADGAVVPCGAGEQAYGVAPYDVAINAVGLVVNSGTVEVDCAGVITINTPVKSDADGKAIAASSTNKVAGIALDTGASGIKIRVKLLTDSISVMA